MTDTAPHDAHVSAAGERVERALVESRESSSSEDPLVRLAWLVHGLDLWHRSGGNVGHSLEDAKCYVLSFVLNVWGAPPADPTPVEPTDAQVETALQALGRSRAGVSAPTMRAALIAAGVTFR